MEPVKAWGQGQAVDQSDLLASLYHLNNYKALISLNFELEIPLVTRPSALWVYHPTLSFLSSFFLSPVVTPLTVF